MFQRSPARHRLSNSERVHIWITLAVLCLLCGCAIGADEEDDNHSSSASISDSSTESEDQHDNTSSPSAPSGSANRQLRITTFNAGLLRYLVPFTDERVRPIAQAVSNHDSDVICLQEVWEQRMVDEILAATNSTYPFVYHPSPRQKYAAKRPVCSESDLMPTLSCMAEHCLAGGGFLECAAVQCRRELAQLAAKDPQCAEAISAQAGKSIGDLAEIADALFSSEPAGLFAFDGSSGLLFLSKHKLSNIELLDFFNSSTTTRRAAVFAAVSLNNEEHFVGCTHLSSNLEGLVPYTGSHGSWEGENAFQADEMISFAQSYAPLGPQYLAGDFNCSIANGETGVNSDFANSCRKFLSAGYDDIAGQTLSCTFCNENLLNQQKSSSSGPEDLLLDHVFTKDSRALGRSAVRVFTEIISANSRQMNLSDHYGVRITAAN